MRERNANPPIRILPHAAQDVASGQIRNWLVGAANFSRGRLPILNFRSDLWSRREYHSIILTYPSESSCVFSIKQSLKPARRKSWVAGAMYA